MGNEWALAEDCEKDGADPHIGGTITRSGGRTEFWLTAPRPKKYSIDEWERIQEEKWNRIFGKNTGVSSGNMNLYTDSATTYGRANEGN